MKKVLIILSILVTSLTSCNLFTDDSPRVEMKGNKVVFHNLTWRKGVLGFSDVSTNLPDFSKIIWKNLRGKSGIVNAERIYKDKDQYGKEIIKVIPFGRINLDKLNMYQTYDDFKSGGIYNIMEGIY